MHRHGKYVLNNILLWLHFIGVGMGVGGGIALSQVGPRLVAAPAEQRELLWSFETFFSRIGAGGLVILLITGPLLLWLKFGGPSGLTWWFWAKMALVVVALIGVGLHEWAARRFRNGDKNVVPLMFIGGRAAGIGIVLAMLCAVFTFN
jgi:protoporphyrinogen IX oxidase